MRRIKGKYRQVLASLLLLKGFNGRTTARAGLSWSCRDVRLVLVLDILSTDRGRGKYFGCVHV